jgi:hypothetical protein
MSDRISSLLQEYDDLVDSVARSTHTLYQGNLQRWFAVIDETPEFAREVARLESIKDFDAWYRDLELRQREHGMGSTQLNLPVNRDAALGMQISLFRRMASRKIKAELFAHVYIAPTERNVNRGLAAFSTQIFMPAARALRRRLERLERSSDPEPVPLLVPAADRTVTLDHNTQDYADAVLALEKVEQAVQQSNDYDDLADKDQRLAELSAGRRLLQATRARAEVLIAVIHRALSHLAKKFADVTIGELAKAALSFLGRLTGLW